MKRLVTQQLLDWKERSDRKPLIVRGARQVGKTYSITDFGKASFRKFAKIDFEKQVNIRRAFDGDLAVKRLLPLLELETETDLTLGDTLLFLDEIQVCPRALAALRYFHEERPDLHVIAAGSLLEFEMDQMSFPVGRVEFLHMYPMTFQEFLLNSGQERLDAQRPGLFDDQPVEPVVHDLLLGKLREYFVVGGMPEAVAAYVATGSFNDVRRVHGSLIDSLLQDMLRYERRIENDILREILEAVPRHVGSAIKIAGLSRHVSHYKIRQALNTLERALLILPVRTSSAAGLPLTGDAAKSSFKLCMADIGLMQFLCGLPAGEILQAEDLLATYKGALSEQFIGQELKAAGGSQNNQLYFWARAEKNSRAEVDYLIVRDGSIIPLEIKHGPSGRLKSLHLFLAEHPSIPRGVVLNTGNAGTVGPIHFMPLYTRL